MIDFHKAAKKAEKARLAVLRYTPGQARTTVLEAQKFAEDQEKKQQVDYVSRSCSWSIKEDEEIPYILVTIGRISQGNRIEEDKVRFYINGKRAKEEKST